MSTAEIINSGYSNITNLGINTALNTEQNKFKQQNNSRNNLILSKLMKFSGIAGEDGQGCWLVSMCFVKNYFNIPLSPAEETWKNFREDFKDILEPNLLNVPHEMFGEAFKKYEQSGIKLRAYRMNRIAFNLIGESMKIHGMPEHHESLNENKSLSTEGIPYPYNVLLHRAGGCTTHMIALDGSDETEKLLKCFMDKKYRIIAVFIFESN